MVEVLDELEDDLDVVAGAGCVAAGAGVVVELVEAADFELVAGAEVVVLEAGAALSLLVELAGAPYQSFTPLCPRHAPCLVAPV